MMTTAIPAATTGRVLHWARGYDLLVWLLTHGRPGTFRERLVDLAHLAAGERVLDVGCGTGSLAIAAKRRVGRSGSVVGIDASPEMIARATHKAARTEPTVSFRIGVAEALPFSNGELDVVLSTLMLHHLPRKPRQVFLGEIRRVLRPGGRVLIVDFGKAQDRQGFLAHVHRHGHVDPGDMAALIGNAGFRIVESGAVGISSLQFVLAMTGSDGS
jgi:ubiquinone/menaquinone biosynthesis C-methylase UbiE